jgi:hypothetical protein
MTPTASELLAALEAELRSRGRPFTRSALTAFVWSVLPLAQDRPDPPFWAGEFLASGAEAVVPD